MVEEAKLGEDDEEGETPLAIVHLIKVEDYGNMSLDVDQLNLRNRSGVRDDLRNIKLREVEEGSRWWGRSGGGGYCGQEESAAWKICILRKLN